MKRKLLITFLVLIVLVLLGTFILGENNTGVFANSPLNAEYIINGQSVKLQNGVAIQDVATGSASKITTNYFGNEVRADLDGDGREDSVFILTQETGGSGVFYYVAGALNTSKGYIGGQALFLGDRIAPQTITVDKNNIIIVNYADRAVGDDFSKPPTVGKSMWLKLDPKTIELTQVAQNATSTPDLSKMNLVMQTWTWVSTNYTDQSSTTPRQAKAFTLSFGSDGRFSATTDCNRLAGKYSTQNVSISFIQIVSTEMSCDNSQESAFTDMLNSAQGYSFTPNGGLVLSLSFGSGTMAFK